MNGKELKAPMGIISAVTTIIGIIIALSQYLHGHKVVVVVMVTSGIAVYILMVYMYKWFRHHCDAKDAKIRVLKAAQFDYKFYAEINSASVKSILSYYELTGEGLAVDIVKGFREKDKRYCQIKDFFESDMVKDFQCLAIREGDKRAKCILQCSFIPIDKNGDTPLIKRAPAHHQKEVETRDKRREHFSFISFSPLPSKFKDAFSIGACYHREVPDRRRPTRFSEIGFVVRMDKNGRIYLFYVMFAHYEDASFKTPSGEMDMKTINEIFAEDPEAKEIRYFKKDHDEIVCITSPRELRYAFCEYHPEKLGASFKKKVIDNLPSPAEDALKDVEKTVIRWIG